MSTTSTASFFVTRITPILQDRPENACPIHLSLKRCLLERQTLFWVKYRWWFRWQQNMELQSVYLSFSTSCPLFWKMVPRDLTVHIYHISAVYVKLYQIRISFVTFNPDVFITCGIGMPKWRKFMFSVLNGLSLNSNGPSTNPTAVSHLSLYCFACSASQSPVTWAFEPFHGTQSMHSPINISILFVLSQCLCAGADDVHEGGLYLIAQLYIRIGSTQLFCRPLA